jgi:hypothetical protein
VAVHEDGFDVYAPLPAHDRAMLTP